MMFLFAGILMPDLSSGKMINNVQDFEKIFLEKSPGSGILFLGLKIYLLPV